MESDFLSLVFKNKQFGNLLLGRFFLMMSFRMLGTLNGWWIYELTHDPFSIGLIGLSEVIPAVSTAFFSGHIIDVNEKRKMLLWCNFAYVFLAIILVMIAFGATHDWVNIHHVPYFIYVVIFFTGIARAFLGPIIPAMIPKIVKKENLPRAVSCNQAAFLTSSVIGHMLGGFLIACISVNGTLIVIVGLMILASFQFYRLKKQYPEYDKIKHDSVLDSVAEGMMYIYKTKEVLGALCLDMFAVLFGGAVAMIPMFAKDVLHVGSTGFGVLNAASDIGSAIVIITLSIFPLRKKQGKILLVSVFGFGLCILFFGLSKYYVLSFLCLMLSGAFDGVSMIVRGTIVQLKTPDHMKGRVFSVNMMFVSSSNEMGQFESGLVAKLIGGVRSVIFGGAMTLVVASVIGLSNKKLRKMEY